MDDKPAGLYYLEDGGKMYRVDAIYERKGGEWVKVYEAKEPKRQEKNDASA